MATLAENLASLASILGKAFLDSPKYASHPLRACIDAVYGHHLSARPALRDLENARVSLLVANLRQIQGHDRRMLAVLKRQLFTSNEDTYFGVRLEISVAASLIRAGRTFLKTESPDFTIESEPDSVFVECTSIHLTRPTTTAEDLYSKLTSAVRAKGATSYCNARTALFIDGRTFTSIRPLPSLEWPLPSIGTEWRLSYPLPTWAQFWYGPTWRTPRAVSTSGSTLGSMPHP